MAYWSVSEPLVLACADGLVGSGAVPAGHQTHLGPCRVTAGSRPGRLTAGSHVTKGPAPHGDRVPVNGAPTLPDLGDAAPDHSQDRGGSHLGQAAEGSRWERSRR